MAIWHFKAYLIPEGALRRHAVCIPEKLSFQAFDDGFWWDERTNWFTAVNGCFNRHFGRSELRGEGMLTWRLEAHSITLYFDWPEIVLAVVAKADARAFCDEFFGRFCEAARDLNCLLYLSSTEVVPPALGPLTAALGRSVARGFLTDPVKTLSDRTRPEFERYQPSETKPADDF